MEDLVDWWRQAKASSYTCLADLSWFEEDSSAANVSVMATSSSKDAEYRSAAESRDESSSVTSKVRDVRYSFLSERLARESKWVVANELVCCGGGPDEAMAAGEAGREEDGREEDGRGSGREATLGEAATDGHSSRRLQSEGSVQ